MPPTTSRKRSNDARRSHSSTRGRVATHRPALPQLSVRLSTPKRARAVFCVAVPARGGTPARFKSAIRPSSPNVAFPRATVQDRLALPADGAPAPFASPSPTVADIERAGEAMMNVSMRARRPPRRSCAAPSRRSRRPGLLVEPSLVRAGGPARASRHARTRARAARPSAPPLATTHGVRVAHSRGLGLDAAPSPSAPCASPPVPHAWVAPGSRPDPPPPPPPPPLRPRWTSAILNRRLCARLLPSPSRSASSRRSRTPTWSPSSAP